MYTGHRVNDEINCHDSGYIIFCYYANPTTEYTKSFDAAGRGLNRTAFPFSREKGQKQTKIFFFPLNQFWGGGVQ